MELMRAKFGLIETKEEDASMIQDLLALMHLQHVDYTSFFRVLGLFQAGTESLNELICDFSWIVNRSTSGLAGTRIGCAKRGVETRTGWSV